jgi:hypothetical protein
MTHANRRSGSHARFSRVAPTYALRIIAADIVQLRGTQSRLIPPRATSDFAVSVASGGCHDPGMGGRLDKTLDETNAQGWTVVNVKRDWKRVVDFQT